MALESIKLGLANISTGPSLPPQQMILHRHCAKWLSYFTFSFRINSRYPITPKITLRLNIPSLLWVQTGIITQQAQLLTQQLVWPPVIQHNDSSSTLIFSLHKSPKAVEGLRAPWKHYQNPKNYSISYFGIFLIGFSCLFHLRKFANHTILKSFIVCFFTSFLAKDASFCAAQSTLAIMWI